MPLSTFDVPWLNSNSMRAYPIDERVDRKDVSGDFQLPDDVLLALYFPIHAGLSVESERFYVQSIAVFPVGLTVTLGYDDGSESPPAVATAQVPLATHTEYRSYPLYGSGDFGDCVGKAVFGTPAAISALPGGFYRFPSSSTRLDSDAIRPSLKGISSVAVRSGGETGKRYYGDIEIFAGNNTRVSASVVGGVQKIRLDAISGEGLSKSCDCAGETPTTAIKTINNISPKPDGDFELSAANCTEVAAVVNGIKFTNTCSQPCCGCPELETISRQLTKFGQGKVTLENFVNRLEGQQSIFSTTVLGSKLGDAPCGV